MQIPYITVTDRDAALKLRAERHKKGLPHMTTEELLKEVAKAGHPTEENKP